MNEQSAQTRVPPVYTWYKVYCAAMALVGIIGIAMPVWFSSMIGAKVEVGRMWAVVGLFVMPFAIAPFLPAKPWVWAYGFVLICAGMARPWFVPAAVPLLIY